jgi:hypothetical protein
MRTLGLVVMVALAGAAVARADIGPAGGELQVNTFTPGSQTMADVAVTPSGKFVVVWSGAGGPGTPGQDGSSSGVFGQRFAPDGARRGGEFRVNTFTTGLQFQPAVVAQPNGDFVVVWTSGSSYDFVGQDGSASGVFLQRFDDQGAPQGGEQQVNTFTRGPQWLPSADMAPDGSMVVVWQSGARFGVPTQDGDGRGIFGQCYDGTGSRAGNEFQVNTYTTGDQSEPAVGMDAAGRFVVTWTSYGYDQPQDGDRSGVFARRFQSNTTPAGP